MVPMSLDVSGGRHSNHGTVSGSAALLCEMSIGRTKFCVKFFVFVCVALSTVCSFKPKPD